MGIRSLSVRSTSTATSGPGRVPASDGRVRRPRASRPGFRPCGARARRRQAMRESLLLRTAAVLGAPPEPQGPSATEPRVPAQHPPAPPCIEKDPVDAHLVDPHPVERWSDPETVRSETGRPGAVHLETVHQGGAGPGGTVPAGADTGGAPTVASATPEAMTGRPLGAVPATAGVRADGAGGSWRARCTRASAAVRDRMPLWMQALQARCGLEVRSVIALVVVLVAAAAFAVQHFWTGRTQPVKAPDVVRAAPPEPHQGPPGQAPAASGAASPAAGAGNTIVVDVSGKVRRPGLQRLPAGSRVADALEAAGGVRPGADTDGLNRARLLADGEQVVVGRQGQAAGPVTGAGAGSAGAQATSSGGTGAAAPAGPVSLNTATPEQLDTLPGVGPVLAQHIIDYRTRHGAFRSVDELHEVNGIGDRRFADLRDLVRL
ncbi:helix-hairpin-helix domain-containing protein [Streptomyces sulfonofaciens]